MKLIDNCSFARALKSVAIAFIIGTFGTLASAQPTTPQAASSEAPKSKIGVWTHFDASISQPYETTADSITFDLSKTHLLNVRVTNAPPRLKVRLKFNEKSTAHFRAQGLMVSQDAEHYVAVPFTLEEGHLVAVLGEDKHYWIATRVPYGRNNLEQLFADIQGAPNLRTYLLRKDHRTVPVFEFGKDDGRKPIHYVIAGECSNEVAGSWAADAMIRRLATDQEFAGQLLDKAVIRIVPHLSPYSSTASTISYTNLLGRGIYLAAMWASPNPPIELELIRNEIESVLRANRLGCFLTLHSWFASSPHSGLEFVRAAGKREVTGERLDWAKTTMAQLIENVPNGSTKIAEKAWKPGLARDYLLDKFGAITFRIEITTAGQARKEFEETGNRLLENINRISSWELAVQE